MSNFMNISSDTDLNEQKYNKPLYGMHGQFTLTADVTVPYFSTLMDIPRATKELKTHEEVAPSLDNKYTLQELFQREIDPNRVRREIVDGYLNVHNKLKFFNSITVALFPKDFSGVILPDFEDYQNNNPEIPAEGSSDFDNSFATFERKTFGGVQYVRAPAANLARLRWDEGHVDAVAVDGQHRLHALKLWMQDRNNSLTEFMKPTRISIIFLLLHEKAGFVANDIDDLSNIKGVAREIFTDLNKNAKEVDQATQIVLDDRSLESLCARALVTPGTCEDHDTLLPLSLLRWREANNRFDQRYFLNSLVNLHLAVGDLLDLTLPSNQMSKNHVANYIRTVENKLSTRNDGKLIVEIDTIGENGEAATEERSLLEHYRADYFDSGSDENDPEPIRPFIGIPPSYLPVAVEGFRIRYSPWILEILTKFQPYAKLLGYARKHNLITGEFAQYHSQPKSARQHLDGVLKHEHGEDWQNIALGQHERAIQNIKCAGPSELGEQWGFKTIFQKSLLRIGKRMALSFTPEERGRLGGINDFLGFTNRLYNADLLRVLSKAPLKPVDCLWAGIATHPSTNRIMVNRKSEDAIEALLWIGYVGVRYAKMQECTISSETGEGYLTPRAVYQAISAKNAQTQWLCSTECSRLKSTLETHNNYFAPTLAERNEIDEWTTDQLQKEYQKIIRERIITILGLFWIQQEKGTEQGDNDTGPLQI